MRYPPNLLAPVPWLLRTAIGAVAALVVSAHAQEPAEPDFTEFSLEALMNVTVTSVSRKEERLQPSPAAVYVIRGDELRRNGIRSYGEALRLAPGLDVAALNAQDYAINARGLSNGSSSNKLEVLMDGRSIYTPLFSGVLWDQQIAFIEDIERIEVIRGPAGTVWGANAVNGVINIVTKSAALTPGLTLLGAAGNETVGYAGARYGFSLGEATQARVYGLGYRLDNSVTPAGQPTRDQYQPRQGGFRADREFTEAGNLTLQGDVFSATAADGPVDTRLSGWNLLSTWRSHGDEDGQWVIHGYLDHYSRDTPMVFGEQRDTQHLELQRRWTASETHDLIGGLSYRRSSDDTEPNRAFTLDPASRTLSTYGALLQDDITLVPERWRLTVGTRYEHNDYTGDEWQPSLRSSYSFGDNDTLWGAASRAVRIPTRLDREGVSTVPSEAGAAGIIADPGGTERPDDPTDTGGGGFISSIFDTLFGTDAPASTRTAFGNSNFKSEELIAYELGYRAVSARGWSLDAAAFYNDYDRLQSVESDGKFGNTVEGRTHGFELLLQYTVSESLILHIDWTSLNTRLDLKPGSTDTTTRAKAGNDPRGYGGLRISLTPSPTSSFDVYLRHVDGRPQLGVHAYEDLNLAWSWLPRPWCRMRLVGRNLLHPQHAEGSDTEIERSGELQLDLSWK